MYLIDDFYINIHILLFKNAIDIKKKIIYLSSIISGALELTNK